MNWEQTQAESPDDARRAQALSLHPSRPPAEVPGYEAEWLVGRGAYGEVWVAKDRNTGRRVAIKFYLHHGGVDWTLLSREVEKLVFLSADRYVVQLLKVGWSAKPPYYVMEYVENGSLDDYLQQRGKLPVREALAIFRELATGLNHAHGKGVLHCDLKPANVLLDQDHRPRLADFGQSRLSHEQKPALGTLFYMAPEQASLDAVPDVRWDVYALGAIFYRMLTGEPPGKTAAAASEIGSSADLPDRLARYRRHLSQSPAPTEHRRIPGMDRWLMDIIQRCLAVDPQRRLANVQEILDALAARDQTQARRPLMLLGFVGPILLLLIMALAGLRGYEHAVRDSEEVVRRRAHESNLFAAMFAASSLAGEIDRYFQVVHEESRDDRFLEAFARVADSPLVQKLNEPRPATELKQIVKTEFLPDPARLELNQRLERIIAEYKSRARDNERAPLIRSLLVLDARGRMLAVAYDSPVTEPSVGKNFAYRDYFHGSGADRDTAADGGGDNAENYVAPESPNILARPHFSSAFRSSTIGTWKVAFSIPIRDSRDPQRIRGVMALTINLGDFKYFRDDRSNRDSRGTRPDRISALIDGREGPRFGLILQHPLLEEQNEPDRVRPRDEDRSGAATVDATGNAAGSAAEDFLEDPQFRVTKDQLEELRTQVVYRYQDPMGRSSAGSQYRGDWIAGIQAVQSASDPELTKDIYLLTQERLDSATEPIQQLGSRLKGEGLWSLGGVAGVILVLWYIVLRVQHETQPHKLGKPAGNGRPASETQPPRT